MKYVRTHHLQLANHMTSKMAKTFAVPLVVVAMVSSSFALWPTSPANAALQAVGAVDPNSGFPLWYQDSNGLKLDLMEAADNFSISDPVDPANPFSQQIGFNAEGFWWSADAAIDNGAQTALLVLAMEGVFAGEAAVDGEQSAFGRLRIRIDGLTPNTQYTVRHPFGTSTFTSDGTGVINEPGGDIGCFSIAGVSTCDPAKVGTGQPPLVSSGTFALALSSQIGPFLTWSTFNPDPALTDPLLKNNQPGFANRIYIGNPSVPHAITGSPVGQNFFRIESPTLPGGFIETNLFTVSGRMADITPPVITLNGNEPDVAIQGFPYVDPGATALDNFDGDLTANIQATTIDTAVLGPQVITYTVADNTFNVATATRTVNVEAPVVTTINITPLNPTIIESQTQQFSAQAFDQVGNPMVTQPAFTWTSGTLATGTIDANGLFTSIANGTSLITATSGLVDGSTTITVEPLTLSTINVAPTSLAIAIGSTRQLAATTLDQLGNSFVATTTWSSDNEAVATVDLNTGLVTAVSSGTATITATSGGAITGNALLVVTPESAQVFRFLNNFTGEHLYASTVGERDNLINNFSNEWKFEFPIFNAFLGDQTPGTSAVFRFVNLQNGQHFYTSSIPERDNLINNFSNEWRFEFPLFNVFMTQLDGTTPIYRLLNIRTGEHFYTSSLAEKNTIVETASDTWRFEFINFFVPVN